MSENIEEKTTFAAPKGLVVVHSLGMTIGGIWALLAGCALLGIGVIAIVYVVPKLEKTAEIISYTAAHLLFCGTLSCLLILLFKVVISLLSFFFVSNCSLYVSSLD